MNIINNLKTLVILSCLYGTAFLAILSGYPAKVSLEVKAFSVKVIVERPGQTHLNLKGVGAA